MEAKRKGLFDSNLNIKIYSLENIFQISPIHYHDYYVIGFIEKGSRHLIHKNKRFILIEDGFLLINPGDSHQVISENGSELIYHAIEIPRTIMENILSQISTYYTLPVFYKPTYTHLQLKELFLPLYRGLIGENVLTPKQKQLLFNKFIAALLRYCAFFPHNNNCLEGKVSAICKYIETHCTENIKISNICNSFSITKTLLFKLFFKYTGMSPHQYLLSSRINMSKILLERSADTSQIALQLGFYDQSHFIHSFRSLNGLAPMQYKKMYIKQ